MTGVPPFALDVVDRLLTTTKAVRRRLDLDRPVPRAVIVECLRLASYAPNASNSQDWRWIVVDDPDQRRRVGEQYRKEVEWRCTKSARLKESAGDEPALGSPVPFSTSQRMADVPVLVIPCYDIDAATDRYGRLLARAGAAG